ISDKALVFSQASAIGLGMAGRVGFKNTFAGLIQNRYFKGGHGLFFKKVLFKDWLDFFSGKQLGKQDGREDPDMWSSFKACLVLYSPLVCFILFFCIIVAFVALCSLRKFIENHRFPLQAVTNRIFTCLKNSQNQKATKATNELLRTVEGLHLRKACIY
ncbi:hypothetical protein QWF21_14530, partial [Alkalimonas sp. MEB004]|nr:hypothetical protein [Alkalimonas sp. MEB004]